MHVWLVGYLPTVHTVPTQIKPIINYNPARLTLCAQTPHLPGSGQEEGGQPAAGGASALLERLHPGVRGAGRPQGAPHPQEELQRHQFLVPALGGPQHAAAPHPPPTHLRAGPARHREPGNQEPVCRVCSRSGRVPFFIT